MIKIETHSGDNRLLLKQFPDNHFASCVCDPPYELSFMGKKWDSSGISYDVEMWREVLRVLKPGAHLLAFGGSRTYHRLACAIEDAGFIIRDQIMWLYGSGFPKSLDVSKGIDKAAGAEREVLGHGPHYSPGRKILKTWREHENRTDDGPRVDNLLSAPSTALSRQWDGWGTALKPAHEPIVVARKPLEGTVIKNVLKWGCGAINIGACGIETCADLGRGPRGIGGGCYAQDVWTKNPDNWVASKTNEFGRWPANAIHDGSDEVLAEFAKYGKLKSGAYPEIRHAGAKSCFGNNVEMKTNNRRETNSGSAARFFYCAKASQEERNRGLETWEALQRDESRKEGNPGGDNPRNRGAKKIKNNHPTVKPIALMAYLVTPPGGVVLDPFMGSGSTLIAAAKEGFDSVGIDLEAEHCELAERRCRGHLGMMVEINSG